MDNLTSDEYYDYDYNELDEDSEHSLKRNIIWGVLFLLISIVGAVGNLIVIWIVLTTKRMRSVTNLFVVNLAVADAMVAILNISFNGSSNILEYWYFGKAICRISEFIGSVSISVSVLTLLAIAIERYLAIMKPLKPRMSKCTTVTIVVTIWSVAVALSIFPITYVQFETVEDKSVCYVDAPEKLELIYAIIFMILTYFIPLIPMAVLYFLIGRELWGSKTIGEISIQQVDNIQKKRRVVKMLIVVVTVFSLCWLPFHIYFIINTIYPEINVNPNIQELFLAVFWLAMSNSMYNPIIYCWMNERYRDGFKRVFRCCPFVKIDNSGRPNKDDRLVAEKSTSDTNTTTSLLQNP